MEASTPTGQHLDMLITYSAGLYFNYIANITLQLARYIATNSFILIYASYSCSHQELACLRKSKMQSIDFTTHILYSCLPHVGYKKSSIC